jgi:DNA-binding transcriptional ArsR family regulator
MESLIDLKRLEKSVAVLKSILHEKRMLILHLLLANGEMNVGEIMNIVNLPQAETSHHLSVIYQGGFLNRRRAGKNICYSAKQSRVKLAVEVAEMIG